MTLLELREDHRAAVIEVGIDEIGAMAEHMQLVNANFAILSTIGPEHLEKLRDVPTVAHEEGIALSTVAQSGGTIVVNLDDPWIRPHFKLLKAVRKIGYTLSSEHRFGEGFVLSGTLGKEGAMLKVSGKDFASTEFALPLLGEHNARNLLGAIAMAHALGLTPGEISKGLRTFKGAAGRSEIQELPRKTPVVCDYYNANPTSVEAGLDLLTQISGTGRGKSRSRWACLADMLELGPNEERFHRELSKKITTLKIENVFLYGPRMKALEDELKKDDFKGRLAHFNSHGEMVAALRAFSPGDALLIKGSRGMKMEKVWEPFKLYAESTWTPK